MLRQTTYQLHFADWDVDKHEIYAPVYSGHLSIADTISEDQLYPLYSLVPKKRGGDAY